jgi:hypothetical protein
VWILLTAQYHHIAVSLIFHIAIKGDSAMKTQNRMLPVAAGAILPAANTVNAFLVRNVDHSDRFGMAAVLICLVLFYKLYSMLESSDRFTFITSLFISAMICGAASYLIRRSPLDLIALPLFGILLVIEWKFRFFTEKKWKKD